MIYNLCTEAAITAASSLYSSGPFFDFVLALGFSGETFAAVSFTRASSFSRVDQGLTPLTPQQNRTCAINAYGSSFSIPTLLCRVYQSEHAPYAQLSCLYSHSLTDPAKCTPLPSDCFHRFLRYYGRIGLPATHLVSSLVPSVVHHTSSVGGDRISDRGMP